MTGYLTYSLGEWMVRREEDDKLYSFCPETQKWSKRPGSQKILKENVEVIFDFIVKGEYCETKEEITKNYFAKIKQIEHSSL